MGYGFSLYKIDYEMSDDKISQEGLLKEHYFHEADRMNQRTDWFLIFHAILMEAFFSVDKNDKNSIIVVGSLGFLLSVLWMISGIRSNKMAWQLSQLIRDEEGEAGKMHEKIFSTRDNTINKNLWYGWTKFLPLYGIVIPFIFIVAWLSLLIIRAKWNWFDIAICLIASVIVLLIIRCTVLLIENKLKPKPEKKV